MRLIILTLACKGLLISDMCHVRFATLVDKKRGVRDDIKMGRTRTDGPDEFEPSKFDCIKPTNTFFLTFNSPNITYS